MKQLTYLFAVAILFTISTYAQEAKPTPAMQAKLSELYKDIEDLKWENEDGNIEASFENNDVKTSIIFDKEAKILEVETEVAESTVPKNIVTIVKEKFAGSKIKGWSKIEYADKSVRYEVDIKKDGKKIEVLYELNGTETKK